MQNNVIHLIDEYSEDRVMGADVIVMKYLTILRGKNHTRMKYLKHNYNLVVKCNLVFPELS